MGSPPAAQLEIDMPTTLICRFLSTVVLGIGLAALPLAISPDGLGDQPAFAKNGGGKGGGNGGGNGGGHGGGKGGGKNNGNGGGHGSGNGGGSGNGADKGGGHAAATDRANGVASRADDGVRGKGKALGNGWGHAKKEDARHDVMEAAAEAPHPSALGRLNGFMNASPEALANAAPNSAIGVVAQGYREALAAYADSINAAPDGAVVVDPALDAAARSLALAANKELTPDVVAAVNAHLAETYANDPALAGFADPNSAESVEAAEAIAAAAEGYQEQEASQGLGLGFASSDEAGDADNLSGEETQAVVIE